MPSIVPGYSYDLFISYRQKDNQYDGWVTDFVDNLKKELAATCKCDVSLYFDANPRDGLSETHHVDDSIREKIKCLIFIPIVSKTYCDVNSFAWSHEFLPFMKQAGEDSIGLKLRLGSGNVASRVLPVCIHEIEQTDKALLEREIGYLRSVDFIFTAPGVNRPLRDREERPFDNQRPLFYRNQINKVANAIGEIVGSLVNQPVTEEVIRPPQMSVPRSDQKSIAVLPFVNMSRDNEQEYFSDGISEEIINMLVKIPSLKVTGRTSSFSFKNKNEDIRAIAEKLNVGHVLEGSIRYSGSLIRITAQLIEASTGYHLWSEKYDREIRDVFAIQDEIANVIADKLKVTLYDSVNKLTERLQTHNVEAYQLYLKGMAMYYRRGIDLFEAQRCFEAALRVDSTYALAWAGLADTYSMLCFHSFITPEVLWPKALDAAQKALDLGPELSESHCAQGSIALLYERNWEKAEREYLKALEINPRNLQARTWYGMFYLQAVRGRHAEAIQHMKVSIENDPLSAYAHAVTAMVIARAGEEDAIVTAQKAVEFQPDAFLPWNMLGNCYHWSGNFKKAAEAYGRALEISGRHTWALTSLLVNFVEAGQMREAESIFHELQLRSKTGHVLPSLLATASAAIGRTGEAMRYASEAFETHDAYLVMGFRDWPDNKYLKAIPAFAQYYKQFKV